MSLPSDAGGRRRLVLSTSTRHDVEVGLPIVLELAAALNSEIATLFVADDAPLSACSLPFPTLVGFSGGTFNFDPSRFEAAVRYEAETCRRVVAQAAERARLAWSFKTLRGETMPLMREASTIGDILVISYDQLGPPPGEMIAIVRNFVPPRGGVLFLRRSNVRREGPLMVIEPVVSPTDRLLQIAGVLARALGGAVDPVVQLTEEGSGDIARARLLVGTIESPLMNDVAALRRIMSGSGPPLLLLRRDFDEWGLPMA